MARILIVEDNELNLDMLTRRLTRRGYEVIGATNGADALTIAARQLPDLILMDLRLPDISGWDVTKRLKCNPATAMIPVIALSAHAMESHRQQAFAAGCDDYDTKPVDLERLVSKIQAMLVKRLKISEAA